MDKVDLINCFDFILLIQRIFINQIHFNVKLIDVQ